MRNRSSLLPPFANSKRDNIVDISQNFTQLRPDSISEITPKTNAKTL